MTRGHAAGVLLVLLSFVYLGTFVPRGWIPHDEGTLGQSAVIVLEGGVPHVDYDDPYTGGLSLMNAAIFRVAGVELTHLRWALFAGAVMALVAMYALLLRFVSPVAAAVAVWIAIVWSFPNYFASLPSWWILICAVVALWGFVRYLERGRLLDAAMAGGACGVSLLAKQTGVYLIVALAMALVYESDRSQRGVRVVVAAAAALLAISVVLLRFASGPAVYLLLPIAVCAGTLAVSEGDRKVGAGLLVALIAAFAPIALFVVPYVLAGHVHDFLSGVVLLPARRLVFATLQMPPTSLIFSGVPFLLVLMPAAPIRFHAMRARLQLVLSLAFLMSIVLLATRNTMAYQAVWQSTRAFVALLPVAICGLVVTHPPRNAFQRRILFGCAVMLAWASLVQFPFPAPIYFCYVAPIGVIAATITAVTFSTIRRPVLHAWAAALLVFGVVVLNRGYIRQLGIASSPQTFESNLDLPRAHLRVSFAERAMYRRVSDLVQNHLGDGVLVAGPDCPEVYFLTGHTIPNGEFFDFFSDAPVNWNDGQVVVLNHASEFSPQLSQGLVDQLRLTFPNGEMVGRKFEVRWR